MKPVQIEILHHQQPGSVSLFIERHGSETKGGRDFAQPDQPEIHRQYEYFIF